MEKFYITTPIYYPSGNPHLGHFYSTLICDIIAKWKRKTIGKENVFFTTGLDEHGQKIYNNAKLQNKTPQEYTDEIGEKFKNLFDYFDFEYDYFVRTSNEKHKTFVKKMLQKSFDSGDIYLANYSGYYCIGCERYYEEKDLEEDYNCHIHKTKCEKKNEENYFFKLSKYQDKILELYEKNPNFIVPKSKKKELTNRIKEGLKDISISRKKKNLPYGIDIPFDENHNCYVWFDALFNYVSSLEINNKNEFWPSNYHIIGSDISWFHRVYFPAFLMSVGLDISKSVFSHGLILDEMGHKMSKSLKNVIEPKAIAEKYGKEEFKTFLLSNPIFDDINFSENKMSNFINNKLNNEFGNLVSRTYSMINKYFDGKIEKVENDDKDFSKNFDGFFDKVNSEFEKLNYSKILDLIFEKIHFVNSYITQKEPWKIKDKNELKKVLNNLVSFFIFYFKFFRNIYATKNL